MRPHHCECRSREDCTRRPCYRSCCVPGGRDPSIPRPHPRPISRPRSLSHSHHHHRGRSRTRTTITQTSSSILRVTPGHWHPCRAVPVPVCRHIVPYTPPTVLGGRIGQVTGPSGTSVGVGGSAGLLPPARHVVSESVIRVRQSERGIDIGILNNPNGRV